DDRVSGDAVQPRRAGPALRLVGARRAPDRDERLLYRILRASSVPEPPQGETEDRTRVTPVQLVERGPVPLAGPLDQVPIRAHGGNPRARQENRHRSVLRMTGGTRFSLEPALERPF